MRWNRWIAFAALCILSGTSWVIPHDGVDLLPPLQQQGLLFGVIGGVALLLTGRKGWSCGIRLHCVRLAGAAIAFFGVPLVVAEYTYGAVPTISRAALFAMVPVVIVMTLAVREPRTEGARRFLIPTLVGLGGLLLLLPLQFSRSVRAWVSLGGVCAAVVLVGLASVWLYELQQGTKFLEALAVAGVANAIFLLLCCVIHEDMVWHLSGFVSLSSVTSLTDVTEILLIVWLSREMWPVRFASRYLLIPLLTVLESYVMIQPKLTARMGFGTALLAAGAAMLLFLEARDEETILSLR
jgi:hypothetical protein